MLVLLVLIPLAIGLALVRGGALENLTVQRLRWWPLAFLALAVQLLLYSPPFDSWPPIVAVGIPLGLASMAVIAAVGIRNARGRAGLGCGLAAIGVVLNLTVMLANGGLMPRAEDLASLPSYVDTSSAAELRLSNVTPAVAETRLIWLADILVEPEWVPGSNIISIGDVILVLGLAVWAYQTTRQSARRVRPETAFA